ncbi:DUF1800 domain-containing protein [Verrucomicrobiota bacterium sgz303538]
MKCGRREFLKVGTGAALALAASGCEEMTDARSWLFGNTAQVLKGSLTPPAAETLDEVSHVLNRLTFGPRPGDYARVTQMGVAAFIDEQLSPEKIDDTPCNRIVRRLETLDDPAGEMFEYKEKFLLEQMTRGALLRAIASRRQVYEIMVQFWTDHFNIDPSKGDCRWLKAADDREVIRKHALGRFSDLVRASALSPAMLWYLDGRENRRRNPTERPNENYARELMELHTLGVHGGYTQQDVMEVARCLTGWTVRDQKKFRKGLVEFKPELHDDGSKTVLGAVIPEGKGKEDLDRVLELVTRHPSTARFIATKLCRRFIADEPPTEAVDATTETFSRTDGDIRATLRTLFARPEFLQARGNKLKKPFHFVVSAIRASNAATDGGKPIIDALIRMGHAPFRYPTPDGYPEESSHWTGTLLWRWNFAATLAANKIKGTQIASEELKKALGGDEALMAHCFGRRPTEAEVHAFRDSEAGMALLFASPAFQRC